MARGDAGRQGTSRGAEDASRHVRAFDGRLLRLAVPEHRALFGAVSVGLILDEATSGVDVAAEAEIQSSLETIRHGRTALVIALLRPCQQLVLYRRFRELAPAYLIERRSGNLARDPPACTRSGLRPVGA